MESVGVIPEGDEEQVSGNNSQAGDSMDDFMMPPPPMHGHGGLSLPLYVPPGTLAATTTTTTSSSSTGINSSRAAHSAARGPRNVPSGRSAVRNISGNYGGYERGGAASAPRGRHPR